MRAHVINNCKIITPLYIKFILLALFVTNINSCSVSSEKNKANVTIDDTIKLNEITEDVRVLASDELQGRGNFSPSINQAAEYIAKRFEEIGLSPTANAPATESISYLQAYTIQRVTPEQLKVKINGKNIAQENLAMTTTSDVIHWSNVDNQTAKDHVNTVVINANTNMRKALKAMNQQGGEHLVLLHPKHKKSFKRYQSYFAKGSLKLASENQTNDKAGGTIVLVLTTADHIESFQVSAQTSTSETILNNVVGIIPGKSKPNEIVLFSAHYDHLGVKNTDLVLTQSTEDIYNGANDDASGVAAIISIANHFKKSGNNERTILFAAFSAEELGGFGSQYFSKQLNPKQIIAMINIEMIGKPAIFGEGTVWMTGMERSNLGEQLNQTLASSAMKVYADPYPNEKLFYRSDNATLARLGVPAHSFSSTQLDKDKDYHQTSDNIQSLNIPSMVTVIKTLAIATTPLVQGKLTPSRIEPSNVKAKGKIY